VRDLQQPWWLGAEWFESRLLDYDPCSNWGNWNYVAGIGNDPRENRYFNPQKQAERYDPAGKFVRLWNRKE
jgi:deoxyribodipyrimidine photo-lyase